MSPITLTRDAIRFLLARIDIRNERGATAVEYGLMVMLIAVTLLVAVVFLGQRTSTTFSCSAKVISTKNSVTGCG